MLLQSATLILTASAGTGGNRRSFLAAAVVTFTAAIVPAILWPGAINWHWDEPSIIGQAFFYNQAHYLATRGLGGTFGVPYGPFPTQAYQFMLLFTHDVRFLVFAQALVISALLASSLLWLAHTLRLTPWFAAAIVLAPYLNWAERDLWGASFVLPAGTMAMAAYAAFLTRRTTWTLALAVAAAALVPLIHLQGMPLFIAIIGHAFWHHRDALWRGRRSIAIALLPLIILNSCYAFIFVNMFIPNVFGMVSHGYGGRSSGSDLLQSLSGPFLGGKIFTGENWVVTRVGLPGPSALVPLAINLAFILIGLIWLGIVVSAVRTFGVWRHPTTPNADVSPEPNATAARDQIMLICLATLAMQIALATLLRVPPDPQYSFGTFPIHILFAWFGVEWLRKIRLAYVVTASYGLAVGYLTIGGNWSVHQRGWSRGLMSPSLNNQIEIARELNRYSHPIVYSNVDIFQRFPRALTVLQCLNPPVNPPVPGDAHHLYIRYEEHGDPTTHRVELIELGRQPCPPDARVIDLSPAKRLY